MPEGMPRDDRGQYDAKVTDRAVLETFAEGRPFHTAQEVADRLDIDRSTAYRRLATLKEEGALRKVALGSRTVVWWLPDPTPYVRDERPPGEIIDDLETFLEARDEPDAPLPSADAVRDDPHARQHREDLAKLVNE